MYLAELGLLFARCFFLCGRLDGPFGDLRCICRSTRRGRRLRLYLAGGLLEADPLWPAACVLPSRHVYSSPTENAMPWPARLRNRYTRGRLATHIVRSVPPAVRRHHLYTTRLCTFRPTFRRVQMRTPWYSARGYLATKAGHCTRKRSAMGYRMRPLSDRLCARAKLSTNTSLGYELQ